MINRTRSEETAPSSHAPIMRTNEVRKMLRTHAKLAWTPKVFTLVYSFVEIGPAVCV